MTAGRERVDGTRLSHDARHRHFHRGYRDGPEDRKRARSRVIASVYRFRDFTLDPRTRELHRGSERLVAPVSTIECMMYLIRHRDRSVGRDELAAAVWGRSDISEVSLSHAIMRARRLLGDSGSEQRSIRTLPRLGYRWVVEPTLEEAVADAATAEPTPKTLPRESAEAATPRIDAPAARSRRRIFLASAFAAVALALAAGSMWFARRAPQPPVSEASGTATATAAMVLPATVENAQADWAWLRLGAMDLIANRLRLGGIATTPSETVVGLVNAGRLDADPRATAGTGVVRPDTLLVHPLVGQVDGGWRVRLRATRGSDALQVETAATDVLAATRSAADELLLRLGHAPLLHAGDGPPSAAELAQRINAAVLSGQTGLAAQLLADAPKELVAAPDVALAQANLEYTSGDYPAALRRVDALLDTVPAAQFPLLRARALNRRGVTRYQLGDRREADQDFVQAIGLLELQNDPDALASAYSGRGAVAGLDLRWDDAVAFFGQARSQRQMVDDAYGVAHADLNLGAVEMARGRPAAAVPIFEDTARRLQELGTPESLATALRDLANAQLILLRYDDALATTARFWPAAAHSANARERWSLTLTRAAALAGKGRLREADALIAQIEQDSDAAADAFERADASSLAADIALQRGENAKAAELAARAMTPAYAAIGGVAYAIAWLERIRGLQRSGQLAAAADQSARFEEWAKTTPDERRTLLARLANADQAAAEGRRAQAAAAYTAALADAERIGVPEYLVLTGTACVENLLALDRLDEATAVAGRLGAFADTDARAAWVQAELYARLQKPAAADKAYAKARELAGEGQPPSSQTPARP